MESNQLSIGTLTYYVCVYMDKYIHSVIPTVIGQHKTVIGNMELQNKISFN